MDPEKRRAVEAAGFRVGDAEELLGLTPAYKGFIGTYDLDPEAGIFHGDVIGTLDVITFQGTTAAEIVQAFHESVDDYLAFCAERGEKPPVRG